MSSLHVREKGKGIPLLFIHGFCETQEIWEEFIEPFVNHFRIITVDLPGFGDSESLKAPFTVDQVADSVAGWLMGNKIPRCMVIGHSLGGYIALSLVDRYPELVHAFGLFHSTSFADTPEKVENRNRVIEFVKKNGVAPYVDTFVPGLFLDKENSAIPEVHRLAMQTRQMTLIGYTMAMRDRPDRTFILRNHEIPKFLIAGVQDTLVPIGISRKMAEISQNCRFYELEGVAHMGIFEAKSRCQEAILESVEAFIKNK